MNRTLEGGGPRSRRSGETVPVTTQSAEDPTAPAEDPTVLARRVAEAMRAADQATAGAGVELVDVGPGRAVTSLLIERRHVNGHGLCHGGYLFLLADSALAYACNSFGVPTVAAGGDIVFVRPGRLGIRVYAAAQLRAASGRSGVYDVTLRADDPEHGEVIAEFRGRSRVVPSMPQVPGA
jgi:acyl-CoA thioesterase